LFPFTATIWILFAPFRLVVSMCSAILDLFAKESASPRSNPKGIQVGNRSHTRSSSRSTPPKPKQPKSLPSHRHISGEHDVLRYLYALSPQQFEQEVARLLRANGYTNVVVVGGAGDRGLDITCADSQSRLVGVQCKRYLPATRVGSKDMQNFVGMLTRFHGRSQGIFVTTAGYTREALRIASGVGIQTFDGTELARAYRDAFPQSSEPRLSAPRSGRTQTRPEWYFVTGNLKHWVKSHQSWLASSLRGRRKWIAWLVVLLLASMISNALRDEAKIMGPSPSSTMMAELSATPTLRNVGSPTPTPLPTLIAIQSPIANASASTVVADLEIFSPSNGNLDSDTLHRTGAGP
jgi:hypothetical protein